MILPEIDQQGPSLWSEAKGFRRLLASAVLISAVAASLQLAAPPPEPVVSVAPAPLVEPAPPPKPPEPEVLPEKQVATISPPPPAHAKAAPAPRPHSQPVPAPSVASQIPSRDCGPNAHYESLASAAGIVVGFMTEEQAQWLLQNTQAQRGMAINPEFLSNKRALVRVGGGTSGPVVTALVPWGMEVRPGDPVHFIGLHVDPAMACHYVPNVIDSRGSPGESVNPSP